jgi:hypothetical protein
MKSYYLVAVFLVGVLVLSACGPSGEAPTPTVDPNLVANIAQTLQAQNPPQGVQTPAGSYQPIDNSVCTSVQKSLQPLYPTANFTVSIQPFTDMNGVSGTACVISGNGTGNDFAGGTGAVVGVIGTTLPGYIQDAMYVASGATGQTSGYRNGNSLAVISVDWQPSPSANCPADQPVSACNVQPVDMLYTVSVSMASTGSPAASPVPSSAPAAAASPVPSSAPAAANSACDKAEFVADVTVPDGTTFSRGDNFDKTWKLRNIGTCTWNTGYFIQYENGPLQPKNKKINLNTNVAPSQSVDITASYNVALDPGTYRSTWSLRNASGAVVPFSNTANNGFYTEIKAKASSAAVAATATTAAPAAATATTAAPAAATATTAAPVAPVGKITSVAPVITFEDGSDLEGPCGQFATYTVTIWVSTDGPVQADYEIIVSDTSGFAADGSFVGSSGPVTGKWTFPAAVAGPASPSLRIEGPYDDPTGITVRVKTGGQTWPPVTVACGAG